MKRFSLRLALATLGIGLLLPASTVFATNTNDWSIQISTPFAANSNKATTHSFNIATNAFSINANDVMTVNVYRDSTANPSLGAFSDNTTLNGNSWTLPVTVPSDGTFTFIAVATNSNDIAQKQVSTTVTVDTAVPGPASYAGKQRSGNTYTLHFTAPSGDVKEVHVYASTSSSFTANGSSQVGVVQVTPGQAVTFTYTAPDSVERFFAVQAYDSAGNGSAYASDPQVTVAAGQPAGGQGGGATATTANATTTNTQAVQGASTTNGQVDGDGATTNDANRNGDVLGAEINKDDANKVAAVVVKKNSNKGWYALAAILVVGGAAYYVLVTRGGWDKLTERNRP